MKEEAHGPAEKQDERYMTQRGEIVKTRTNIQRRHTSRAPDQERRKYIGVKQRENRHAYRSNMRDPMYRLLFLLRTVSTNEKKIWDLSANMGLLWI